jgi:hypothetical protein
MRVSSVTVTFCTRRARNSIAKELIPTPQQISFVLFDQPLYPIDFASTESPTILEANGIEPKLGFHVLSLNVDMRRLVSIAGVEEKPVWPFYRYGWH